jgi:hypothetical protein
MPTECPKSPSPRSPLSKRIRSLFKKKTMLKIAMALPNVISKVDALWNIIDFITKLLG